MLIAKRQISVENISPHFDGLCFTAITPNSKISMQRIGNPPTPTLETSFDGITWNPFHIGITTIDLKNIGDFVYFRAQNDNTAFSSNANSYNTYVMTGTISASGNIQSLLTKDFASSFSVGDYCFTGLFKDCESLISPPDLPATILGNYCYEKMFSSCKGLKSTPILNSTVMKNSCYRNMFSDCTSLTQAPELPATTLDDNCYLFMFRFCSSLESAPSILPAKTLKPLCYSNMFQGCPLRTAPTILAETTAPECCKRMFYNCKNLENIELPATQLESECYYAMFQGCSNLNSIRVNFVNWNTDSTVDWLLYTSSNGTFFCKPELGTQETILRGNSYCKSGWIVKNI